jgi:hypothetical protein
VCCVVFIPIGFSEHYQLNCANYINYWYYRLRAYAGPKTNKEKVFIPLFSRVSLIVFLQKYYIAS